MAGNGDGTGMAWSDPEVLRMAVKSVECSAEPKRFENWQRSVENACVELEYGTEYDPEDPESQSWPTAREAVVVLKKWAGAVKAPKKRTGKTVYEQAQRVEADPFKMRVICAVRVALTQPAILEFIGQKYKGCEASDEIFGGHTAERWDERSGMVDGCELAGTEGELIAAIEAKDLDAFNAVVVAWQPIDCV